MGEFRCREFAVSQRRTAMKICTDSLLFGAITEVPAGSRVLDIGTGCGLLALMALQLGAGRATGVEICADACAEAGENFARSPWPQRLTAVNTSIQSYAVANPAQAYDLIVCNPPFFVDHLRSAAPARRQARHADSLAYADLALAAARMLAAGGRFQVLLPCSAVREFRDVAETAGLHLHSLVGFRGLPHGRLKTAALGFRDVSGPCAESEITVYAAPGTYGSDARRYLQPFLLRL